MLIAMKTSRNVIKRWAPLSPGLSELMLWHVMQPLSIASFSIAASAIAKLLNINDAVIKMDEQMVLLFFILVPQINLKR